MIYIIQGQEEFFIREKITNIIKENEGEVSRFDGSSKDFSIDSMLESCQGNTLFSSASIVLVDQPYFLIKKTDDKELERLYRYVDEPVYDTQLIFFTYLNNFNQKLKAYKKISSNAQIITLNPLDQKNFNNYVSSRISEEGLKLDRDSIFLLNSMCKRDSGLLNRNIELLKLYPDKIDQKVILRLCTTSDENDNFELINSFTDKDVSRAISVERKMLSQNGSALSVIGLLANQLRFLYQIAYYKDLGKRSNEIMELAGITDYRLRKANEALEKLDMEEIMRLLHQLSDLDVKCKSDSSIPENTRFEMFILKLLKG